MSVAEDPKAVLARYEEGPALLERALAGLTDAELDARPRAGGWTIRQIVHHLADGDDLWKVGLKAALGYPDGEFTLAWYWALPQEEWAESWAYSRRALGPSLALLRASRNQVRQLLAEVPDAWTRTIGVRRPDGDVATIAVGEIVKMQADHVEHHVARILAVRRERGGT
jgi:uncharacterized damage-inducible protein DinB